MEELAHTLWSIEFDFKTTADMNPEDSENTPIMTKHVQCREGWFCYKNPREWKFSLLSFCHILKNIRHYVNYFLGHRSSKPNSADLKFHLPVAEELQLQRLKNPPERGIHVLWIGHASLLVQIDGINILTDPVFHDCGPSLFGYRYFNYKRFRGPAVTAEDLRDLGVQVNAIVISHDHFDHLDEESVSELVKAYPDGIQWLVPKNMKHWFQRMNCTNVRDMTWWEDFRTENRLTVTCTPAKHWCGRGLRYYYCRHLWCSWFIRGPRGSKFFFAGDTGYAQDLFPSIREKCGAPDLAAIPIGACKPRPVMKAQHIDPEEAVVVHRELEAKNSIAIHWGTFAMSNEKIDELKNDFKNAHKQPQDGTFVTMEHGEVKKFVTTDMSEGDHPSC